MNIRGLAILSTTALLAACTTTPYPYPPAYPPRYPAPAPITPQPQPVPTYTPAPSGLLPDTVTFSQKDTRWAKERMGGSGASLADEGCLVTAVSMVLNNLGHPTDPGRLNSQLKANKGYTGSGLLIWSALDRITQGRTKHRFYKTYNPSQVDQCLASGDYPLVRFNLPNGRTHWAMVLGKAAQGYYMRDPLHTSQGPLVFPTGSRGFTAVRCVGPA